LGHSSPHDADCGRQKEAAGVCGGRGGSMGTGCGKKGNAAEVRALSWCESGSEPRNRAVRRCCRVVRRRVKPPVTWGQDTSRHGAAKHANFSKWDIDFMLRGSGVGVHRAIASSISHHRLLSFNDGQAPARISREVRRWAQIGLAERAVAPFRRSGFAR
jgi:hypothetical protein